MLLCRELYKKVAKIKLKQEPNCVSTLSLVRNSFNGLEGEKNEPGTSDAGCDGDAKTLSDVSMLT
jgi:hypothetical protein